MGRNVVGDPDVAADDAVVPDGDASEDGGVGIDGDVVFDNRVARHVQYVAILVVLKALGAECHALIEGDVVADDAGLADDDARAVVDGEVLADGGSGMDVDASLRVCQFGDDAWDDGHLQLMQLMGDAVVRHGVHDGIAEDDFAVVRGGGVVVEHGLGVGIEQPFDFGQFVDELQCHPLGLLIDLFFRRRYLAVLAELQSVSYLFAQQSVEFLHVYADVVRADGLVRLSFVEEVGEYDVLRQCHDLFHLLHRGQRGLYGGHHFHFLLGEFRQLLYVLEQCLVRLLVHRLNV